MSAIEAVAETSRPSLLLATIPLTRGTVRRARWATTSGRSGQQYLMPASLRDWLPEEDVVWLFLDAVDQMDLGPIFARYRTDGWGAGVRPGIDDHPPAARLRDRGALQPTVSTWLHRRIERLRTAPVDQGREQGPEG